MLWRTAKLVFPQSCRLMHVFVANYLQNITCSYKRGVVCFFCFLFFKSGQACNITSESLTRHRECLMFYWTLHLCPFWFWVLLIPHKSPTLDPSNQPHIISVEVSCVGGFGSSTVKPAGGSVYLYPGWTRLYWQLFIIKASEILIDSKSS